jgi:ABC-type Zn uptake system ZnuABC Zn-binding protein ZnuA
MSRRQQVYITVFGICLLGLGLAGCTKPADPWPAGKSPRILVSFVPIYCFAANVAGDEGVVLPLLTSTGPHEHQPVARDAIKMQGANIFFINGLGLDDAFGNMLKRAGGKSDLRFVELGEDLKELIPMGAHGHDHDGHEHHGHEHGQFDPHVWLGIPEAVQMVGKIRDNLKSVNPSAAATYDQNAERYIKKLQDLQADGKARLASKANRKVVTFHESLAYFARTFGLTIVGSVQEQAGVEPNSAKMTELARKCKEQGVQVIAVEPQFPEDKARTLTREVPGARIVTLDPLETAAPEALTPDYYERKMRENLNSLADALP